MAFDYKQTGLEDRQDWKLAATICHTWLQRHMSMFGDKGIANFMHNQPVAAVKRLQDNCDDVSPESVTVLLMGPAKGNVIANADVEKVSRQHLGDRTVDLVKAMAGQQAPLDAAMERDMKRVFLAEGLSTMHDQLIGRARIDKHHQVRWDILRDFEQKFVKIRGQDPDLEDLFAQGLRDSRRALQDLDDAAKNKNNPKPPKI